MCCPGRMYTASLRAVPFGRGGAAQAARSAAASPSPKSRFMCGHRRAGHRGSAASASARRHPSALTLFNESTSVCRAGHRRSASARARAPYAPIALAPRTSTSLQGGGRGCSSRVLQQVHQLGCSLEPEAAVAQVQKAQWGQAAAAPRDSSSFRQCTPWGPSGFSLRRRRRGCLPEASISILWEQVLLF